MAEAVLDLQYLPNIYWFTQFLKYETIWIEQEENYIKSTYRNRCEIAGANGKQTLTIPLLGGRDHHQKYKDTLISYQSNWQNNHWQSILSAYGSAPYFEYYADKFQGLYNKQVPLLFNFNLEMLNLILRLIKLKKPFQLTSDYEKIPPDKIDLRSSRLSMHKVEIRPTKYYQVFESKNGFIPNLSIIDLIFNMGPGALDYLKTV
jgi:hypothetical protein